MLVGVNADRTHHLQCFSVSANQNVLAVVQGQALVHDPTRTPAHLRCGFQQTHLPALLHGMHGSGQSRPARTHDGEFFQNRPNACIFQASHNLRTGVSDTRCWSTGNWAWAISCSKVR